MKTFIFDKKDYKSYKDMYTDMAHKFGCDQYEEYFDTKTMDYSGDILWEVLETDIGFHEKYIDIILVNFDKEKIKLHESYDDYKYNIIIEVFEDFVHKYPNNILEFRN